MTATIHLLPHVCRTQWMHNYGCRVVIGRYGQLYARETTKRES